MLDRIREKRQKLGKKCCYNSCYNNNHNTDDTVQLIPFPKTCLRIKRIIRAKNVENHLNRCFKCEKAARWAKLCNNSSIESLCDVTKEMYVCSVHFIGGKGPSETYPDPVADINCTIQDPDDLKDIFTNGIEVEEIGLHSLDAFQQKFQNLHSIDGVQEVFKKDDELCQFFTGLSYGIISRFLKFLGEPPKVVNDCFEKVTTLTPLQQLILVLMHLRRQFSLKYSCSFRNIMPKGLIKLLMLVWIPFLHEGFKRKLKDKMPTKVDLKKLRDYEILKNVDSFDADPNLIPLVLVCACLECIQMVW